MANNNDFVLQTIPGKGKGVVAKRAFTRGEMILSEKPLFTQFIVRNNETILSALSKCSPKDRKAYYALHNCHEGTLPPALGIFETNALPCGDNDVYGHKAQQGGIFLLGSRFNSSCTPNVNNHWNEETQCETFLAMRDIDAGEELCIGYGNYLASKADRQRELKMKFKFDCMCSACSLSGQQLSDSDSRRETIGVLYHAYGSQMSSDPIKEIGEVMIALRFLREEGLPVYESSFYHLGFHICAAVSDFASAKAWAQKAWESSVAVIGESGDSRYARWLQNPESYAHAGKWGKRTLAGPDSPVWNFLGLIIRSEH